MIITLSVLALAYFLGAVVFFLGRRHAQFGVESEEGLVSNLQPERPSMKSELFRSDHAQAA
jgi:hypothetical protein